MARLYRRGDTWYADYIDRDGRRQRRSCRTGDVKVARARVRDLELATTDRAAHPTEALADALDYFVDVACAGKPEGTRRSYGQKARHVSRLLGEVLLDRLTRENVERYIAVRLAEGAHSHTVHKELVVLRGALASARERDRFHGGDVVPKFRAGYVPRTAHLTPEQFMTLTEHLVRPIGAKATEATRARREAQRTNRTLRCLLIALGGPRLGELERLRWEHVDFARGVIRVPKGKTQSRTVAIHPVLRPWLEHLDAGAGPIVEPWPNMGRDLPAACRRAGVPRCTANDLRRTFASWLVQGGVPLIVVSRLLGHGSTRMVDLVYGQLDEATLLGAIAKLPGGCDAGVPHASARIGTGGTNGATASPTSITISVEESTIANGSEVPRDGVEPPTRGFSVPLPNAPKVARSRPKLKLVG